MAGVKGKSGGKREGAGRPRSGQTKPVISLRLDPDLFEYVSLKKNKSKFINGCIRKEKERDKKPE